jgi:hypothetical protein
MPSTPRESLLAMGRGLVAGGAVALLAGIPGVCRDVARLSARRLPLDAGRWHRCPEEPRHRRLQARRSSRRGTRRRRSTGSANAGAPSLVADGTCEGSSSSVSDKVVRRRYRIPERVRGLHIRHDRPAERVHRSMTATTVSVNLRLQRGSVTCIMHESPLSRSARVLARHSARVRATVVLMERWGAQTLQLIEKLYHPHPHGADDVPPLLSLPEPCGNVPVFRGCGTCCRRRRAQCRSSSGSARSSGSTRPKGRQFRRLRNVARTPGGREAVPPGQVVIGDGEGNELPADGSISSDGSITSRTRQRRHRRSEASTSSATSAIGADGFCPDRPQRTGHLRRRQHLSAEINGPARASARSPAAAIGVPDEEWGKRCSLSSAAPASTRRTPWRRPPGAPDRLALQVSSRIAFVVSACAGNGKIWRGRRRTGRCGHHVTDLVAELRDWLAAHWDRDQSGGGGTDSGRRVDAILPVDC